MPRGGWILVLGVCISFWAAVFSIIVHLCDLIFIHPLESARFAIGCSALLVAAITVGARFVAGSATFPSKILPEVACIVAVVAVCSAYAGLFWTAPSQGWDALDHWYQQAFLFIEHSERGKAAVFPYEHRHPRFLPLLTSLLLYDHKCAFGAHALSMIFGLSLVVTIVGFSIAIGLNRGVSCVFGLSIFTIPLLENHILIGGYAELPVAAAVLCSAACLYYSVLKSSLWFLIFGVVMSLIPVLFKNTGPFYAALVLFGPLAYMVFGMQKRNIGLLALLMVAGACVSVSNDWSASLFGQEFGYAVEGSVVSFASKQLVFSLDNAYEVWASAFTSVFINSSFSIFVLAGLASALTLLSERDVRLTARQLRQYLVVLVPFLLGLAFMIVSLFSDYGFRFGVIGNDTGHSRFTMPVVALSLLLVILRLSAYHERNDDSWS